MNYKATALLDEGREQLKSLKKTIEDSANSSNKYAKIDECASLIFPGEDITLESSNELLRSKATVLRFCTRKSSFLSALGVSALIAIYSSSPFSAREVRLSEQSGLRLPAIANVSSGTALATVHSNAAMPPVSTNDREIIYCGEDSYYDICISQCGENAHFGPGKKPSCYCNRYYKPNVDGICERADTCGEDAYYDGYEKGCVCKERHYEMNKHDVCIPITCGENELYDSKYRICRPQ